MAKIRLVIDMPGTHGRGMSAEEVGEIAMEYARGGQLPGDVSSIEVELEPEDARSTWPALTLIQGGRL